MLAFQWQRVFDLCIEIHQSILRMDIFGKHICNTLQFNLHTKYQMWWVTCPWQAAIIRVMGAMQSCLVMSKNRTASFVIQEVCRELDFARHDCFRVCHRKAS